jgi:hypothetical protein
MLHYLQLIKFLLKLALILHITNIFLLNGGFFMKNKTLLSLILSFSTLFGGTFLISNNVHAETIVKLSEVSQNNLSQSPQPTATFNSNGKLKPLKLTMAEVKAIPGVYSTPIFTDTNFTFATASYTAPYSQISTPLGYAMFLQQGCTDTDPRAYGWVSALQVDLNQLSNAYGIGINLATDGSYGPATTAGVKKFQTYIKNSWGCSSMSIDGVAGYQTWTAIYALYNGSNPHSYIP